ncbi:MAG: DUF373 family protein, partial [archaeon]|nr:DUF373 family protein [archaeon]
MAQISPDKRILVICVDRDNDLGRKAGVKGPVIGKKDCLDAANKLGLKDPEDSDVNAILATIKKFEEVKKDYPSSEVVILTGYDKTDYKSDKEVLEQLEIVLEQLPADGFVLVSDGAEDESVIPIITGRIPMISKQVIIVKQAKAIESTYYTIKEALKDPYISRIVFGIPGILLLLYFFFGNYSIQIVSFVLGAYLLIKGFGIEEKVISNVRNFTSSLSPQRTSFPFYVGGLLIIAFGIYSAYNTFFIALAREEVLVRAVSAFSDFVFFVMLTAIAFTIGKIIDSFHLRKAYRIRKYILYGIFAIMGWFMLDSAKAVIIGSADLTWFIFVIIASFAVLLITYRVSAVLDVRRRITSLLLGVPVYASNGRWLGKVEQINKETRTIEYKDLKTKQLIRVGNKQFVFKKGKIVLS